MALSSKVTLVVLAVLMSSEFICGFLPQLTYSTTGIRTSEIVTRRTMSTRRQSLSSFAPSLSYPTISFMNRVKSHKIPVSMKRNDSNGPAILDRPAVEKETSKTPAKLQRRVNSDCWEVRLYNDGINTREFVARCLVQVAGLSEISAYQTMMQAHQNGIAVVGIYVYELAEMYHDAFRRNGIISDLVPVENRS